MRVSVLLLSLTIAVPQHEQPALGVDVLGANEGECPQASVLSADETSPSVVSRIAFGSCGEQHKPWPILNTTLAMHPDLFLFLGDNVYGDTFDMEVLRAAYANLSASEEFRALWKSKTRVLATWDDHDFGWNDAGRAYPHKYESKRLFMEFFREPASSLRRQREGIYSSYVFGPVGQRVQVIMLDLRWFRDDLVRWAGEEDDVRGFFYEKYYSVLDSSKQLLGEMQWSWLAHQLRTPAEVRLICSSTQVGISYNGYEAWANFPHELERLRTLIASTRAEGVLFLSGDVHYAELSVLNGGGYPLYDLTSSGITSTWSFATPNTNRIAGPVMENHIGMVDIDWRGDESTVRLRIVNVKNTTRIDHTIRLADLTFPNKASAHDEVACKLKNTK